MCSWLGTARPCWENASLLPPRCARAVATVGSIGQGVSSRAAAAAPGHCSTGTLRWATAALDHCARPLQHWATALGHYSTEPL
eukprot:1396587-Pyramimonas_sp.AAC.1